MQTMQRPSTFSVEVNPAVPDRIARLAELADNLWYAWDPSTRSLFARLDPELWRAVGQSPKALLKRVDESRLESAAQDPVFLHAYNHVLTTFDTYLGERVAPEPGGDDDPGLVAYFCAEFGIHESLPIYSGGLGILAGDHCKAASDAQLPFVAVGLLYRQGYFVQTIDADGQQLAHYNDSDFDDMPVSPVVDAGGQDLHVHIRLGEREVAAKVWRCRVGRIELYLLDSDVAANSADDRLITYRLYGGDATTRLEQEMLLGIGGARALGMLGIKPDVWHVNEGHAAFLVVERIGEAVRAGIDQDAALEAVAASTVFTTHTPVPAGHDAFPVTAAGASLAGECTHSGIDLARVLALGQPPGGDTFNMTTLALRGSRFHNGVSRIHGGVSAQLLGDLWPQVAVDDNPIGYITNGVHVPTFLATEWSAVFDRFLGHGWARRLDDPATRRALFAIPDQVFWSTHQQLKTQLLKLLQRRVRAQYLRNGGSESHLDRMLRCVRADDPNVLTIGFGRRFATYKRATLLFNDIDVLRRIVDDAARPVVFIFAGKAHPADEPGQDLIRAIARMSREPEFEGRVVLVEDYDMRFARHLVAGVDVWLNTPVYPLEASGTSGMKAGMNGVINLSILDGWWGEGYDGSNGWAIKPDTQTEDPFRRDREDARTLYEVLREHVVPLYYARPHGGMPGDWIAMAKRSMASILPRFNADRMLREYMQTSYAPGARQGRIYRQHNAAAAAEIAGWKTRVRAAWPGVTIRRVDAPPRRISFGDAVTLEVAVNLNGLAPRDVAVELLLRRGQAAPSLREQRHAFAADPAAHADGQHYVLRLRPDLCGRLDYQIRMHPAHTLLTHPFELGLMQWV